MQRLSLVATGLLVVSQCTFLLASAAPPDALPLEQRQGAVTYVSGGIRQDEV
jgi:hypothetical protein